MKLFILVSLCALCISGAAQKTYQENIETGGIKIMKGLLSKEVLQYEDTYKWFAQNTANYVASATAIDALKKNGSKIQIIAFGGTWCEDTQNILPKFYQLITAAGFPQSNLTLWGVDRNKKTYGALAEALGVTNVPTFIIMQNGKELGRVVEYGKTGKWDAEIGEAVNLAK